MSGLRVVPATMTPEQRRSQRLWGVFFLIVFSSPCVLGAAVSVLGGPQAGGTFVLLLVGVYLIASGTAITFAIRAGNRARRARPPQQRFPRCRHCGYPIEFDGHGRRCSECGKLPYDLDDRGMQAVDMACQGCGRHITELPKGDSCPFCGHGLAYAQAAELVRRASATGATPSGSG